MPGSHFFYSPESILKHPFEQKAALVVNGMTTFGC